MGYELQPDALYQSHGTVLESEQLFPHLAVLPVGAAHRPYDFGSPLHAEDLAPVHPAADYREALEKLAKNMDVF